MTLWLSTAHHLLWNLLEPTLQIIWRVQTEKCELEGDQHPCPDVPDLQGKKQLETEPETFTPPRGVLLNMGSVSWGMCNLHSNQFSRPGASPADHSVIHTSHLGR